MEGLLGAKHNTWLQECSETLDEQNLCPCGCGGERERKNKPFLFKQHSTRGTVL